jgi:hypothetical protein
MAPDSLIPAALRPWFVLPAIWRESMATISDKAFARIEAVKYHLDGVPLQWRDGFVVVQRPNTPEFVLACDLKSLEDLAVMLDAAKAQALLLPEDWPMRTLSQYPDWYRRHGFRVPMPPRFEVVCNVLYCPGGKWGTVPAIDLGAVSA